MPVTGLHGPHSLTLDGVANAVRGIGAGAYALGYTDSENAFHVQYVGRSDDDLGARLRTHVPKSYAQFKYGFLPTSAAAYRKECSLYHDFKPPDNKVHPATPRNENLVCPVCGE